MAGENDDLTNNSFSDENLTPEEQAQFDAMRSGGDVETAQPAPGPEVVPPQQQQPDPNAPPIDPNDPDPDLEIVDPKTNTKQRRVSFHKFQRTENRAKDLEKQLEDARKAQQANDEKYARLDERLRILNEALTTPPAQQQPQQIEVPDPQKDIFGFAYYIKEQLDQANKRIEAFEEAGRQQAADQELATTYESDAARFASTEPSFAAAYVHLIRQRDRELELNGVTDKRKREQQIVREEKGLVRGAIESGVSPAQRIFDLALARGFNKEAAAAAAQQQRSAQAPAGGAAQPAAPKKDPNALDAQAAAARPAGGHQAPANGGGQQPSVMAEIEAIKNGQRAAMSLDRGGGNSPPQELTSQMLADMPEEEFNEIIARLSPTRLRELMGN